jgi:arylsulfatase A-like enzyme
MTFVTLHVRFSQSYLLSLAMFAALTASAAPPPNVLMIVTDDQGWWDLAAHGNPVLRTPRLDALFRESVEFTRFYASPVCSLTRASLMTGRYPQRTGCFDTRFGHDTLAKSESTMGDLFKAAGYRTAAFGKWHLGRYMSYHPNERGFDEYFGFWQYGHVERYWNPDRMWHNKQPVACRGHSTDLITDAALDYIAAVEQPFLCYVAYNAPHAPWQAEDALVEHYLAQGVDYRNARIYALIEQCDRNVGRLLDALDAQQLQDNTIVLFMSDNGGVSNHYVADLRGSKGTVYEGGVRSPLAVRYPPRFPAGAKVDAMAGVIDLLPTLANAAGVAMPSDRVIDGKSLLPLLENGAGESPHSRMYHAWSRGRPTSDRNWAVCDKRFKLVNGQLFDLVEDPAEEHDLAAEQPARVAELRKDFLAWFAQVCDGQEFGRVPIEVGRGDENPVELQPSWANLLGSHTQYHFDAYDWDFIDGWDEVGDAASWELNVVRPGRYLVTLAYSAGSKESDGEFTVRAGDAQLAGKVAETPTVTTFVERQIGEVMLQAGAQVLSIEATRIRGPQLMALNRVVLTRLP